MELMMVTYSLNIHIFIIIRHIKTCTFVHLFVLEEYGGPWWSPVNLLMCGEFQSLSTPWFGKLSLIFSPNKGNKACRFPVHLKFVVIYHSHCLLPTLVSTTCRGCYQLNLLIEVYAFLSSLRVTVLPRCRCGSCESRWWQHDSSHNNN